MKHLRQHKVWMVVVCGVVSELLYLVFYFLPESPDEVLAFILVQAVAFGLYTMAAVSVRRSEAAAQLWPIVLLFAVVFRLTLIWHPPVGSDDIYRYVWDGKVAAHGINPFAYAPDDPALNHLHTADLPSRINFPGMRTIYPPLAQVLFFVSNMFFGDSLAGLKFLLVCAEMLTLLVLYRLTQGSVANLILYAWSPLPVMYVALDGHIDALGIPFLLLAVLLVRERKILASSFALGLSVLAKLYPLFLSPLLFWEERNGKRFLIAAVPFVLLAAGAAVYWESTGGLVESFVVFNSTFEFNGSVFHLVYEYVIHVNEKAHAVSSVLFVVWMGFIFFLKRSFEEKTFLAFLGFIILAPVVQPWYLLWIAALLSLRWSLSVFVLLALSNISNLVVYYYRLDGVWQENSLLLLLEYVPFFVLLTWEIARGGFRSENKQLFSQH